MSYLSEISCTDRDVLCVATKIRSAYSSVSNRETSFSRIVLDSAMGVNSSIYPVLGFDTRGSGWTRRFRPAIGRHTIGRRIAFGAPPDQSQERLNSSVYGFCPYRTTEPFTLSIWTTRWARFSRRAADRLWGVTNPTNRSFDLRIEEKTPDISSTTFSP